MKNNDPILQRISEIIKFNPECSKDFCYSPNGNYFSKFIEFDYPVDDEGMKILKSAVNQLQLTIKQLERIERICKGIMLLDKSETAKPEHIVEAIQYVCYDKA